MSKTKIVKDSIAEISNLLSRFETSIAGKSKKAVDAVKETPSPRSFVKSADEGAKASDELIAKQLQDSDLAKKSFESSKANVSGSPAIKDAQTLSNIDTLKNTTPRNGGIGGFDSNKVSTQFVEPLNISNPMGVQPKVLDDIINPQSEATAFGKPISSYNKSNKNINPKILAGVAATGLIGRELMSGDDKFGPIDGQLMSKGAPASTKDIKPKDVITKSTSTESSKQGAVQVQPKEIESVKDKHPQEMVEKELNDHISAKQEEMDYLQELRDARQTASMQRLMGGIIQAGQSANQAVTGVKQDAGGELIKDADRHVVEAKENIALDKSIKEERQKKDLESHLNDPNSPALASVNDMLSKLNQPVIPKGMTLGQYQKVTGIDASKLLGFIQNKETQQEATKARLELARESRFQREQDRSDKKNDRLDLQSQAQEDKRKLVLEEVEDRKKNILDNIKIAEDMITEHGTTELMGSHNENLNRLIDNMAVDMAKLGDPKSVARPAEVEMYKRGLFTSGAGGMKLRNATALDILSKFKAEVAKRADTAYAVRGFKQNDSLSTPIGKIPEGVVPTAKTVVKKGFNPNTNQTQFIYSDGTKEIKDGKL